jgi:hypothetical protein
MPPVEFEPTISAGERPQTYVLDRAATGTGESPIYPRLFRDNGDELSKTLLSQSFLGFSFFGGGEGGLRWLTGQYSEIGFDFLLQDPT